VRSQPCLEETVEVKDVKGRQNENQIAFQRAFEEAGGVYILARRLEDVYQIAA
jgi:hypothetical protein